MSQDLQDLGALIESKQSDAIVGYEVNAMGELVMQVIPAALPKPVSYTHLTLPTIYSV